MAVLWLDDVTADDLELVGGKGASLGELTGAGLPVPSGFVVSAGTYRSFIEDTGIEDELFAAVDVDTEDSAALAEAESRAEELILDTEMPEEIRQVRDAVDTPIMEHVFHADFALELLEADAVDVFVVTQSDGGIAYADRLLDIAYASGVEARLSTTVETELGALAAVALGASSPAVTYPCDINGPAIYADSPLQSPVEYQDGTLSPREAPGFGIDLKPGFF